MNVKTAPKNIDKENKPKPSLIPMDLLIKVLEPAYQEGLLKYYRESWRLGFKTSDMYDGAMRHLSAYFYDKEDYDPDAAELGIEKLHLGGAIFCLICMCDTLLNHPELDDRDKDYKEDEKILKKIVNGDLDLVYDIDRIFPPSYDKGGIVPSDTTQ